MQSNVVVTGGAGYIGSHVALALRDAGWPVIIVDNLATGAVNLVPDGVMFINADCGDTEHMRMLFAEYRTCAVIHLAASVSVPESVSFPVKYYLNNTANTARLIEICVDANVEKFIYSSTAAIYGEPEFVPVSENAPPRPVSPYGKSKLMGEEMLADVTCAHPLRYVTLRYFNVAGADAVGRVGPTEEASHLVRVALKTAAGLRSSMEIYGTDYDTPDGTCIRDYVHVSDLAEAHVAALNYLVAGGESNVFNCGYGRGHSVREVISTVRRVTGVNFKTNKAPRRRGDIARLICASQRIRDSLGWLPKYDNLATIVRTAWNWECRLRDGTAFNNGRNFDYGMRTP